MSYNYVEIVRREVTREKSSYWVHVGPEEKYMEKICDVLCLTGFTLRDQLFDQVMEELGFKPSEQVFDPGMVTSFYI
jgi:hypothetical protein